MEANKQIQTKAKKKTKNKTKQIQGSFDNNRN
jgi:hypothetical protein